MTNKPESNNGVDWEPANNIIGSLTSKFSLVIVELVPITVRLPLIVIVSPLSVIKLSPKDVEPVHLAILLVVPDAEIPLPVNVQLVVIVASVPDK